MRPRWRSPERPIRRLRTLFSRRHIAVMLIVALAVAGCAPTKPKEKTGASGIFGSLYEGKSKLIFGTEIPATSTSEAMQSADLAASTGDSDKALFHYIRALELDEHNAEALYKIGAIHAERGNSRLAELAYRWALKEQPRHVAALNGLGILLLKQRKYAEAKRNLELAVSIEDRLASAHNALGVIADLNRDFATAQSHYEKSLAVAPRAPAVLNNLGYSKYLAGKWKDAIKNFRKALLIDPQYELAWRNLALVYVRQKRYTEAVETLSKVEELPKAYNDVGYIAMVEGKLDDAKGFFEEAKRLSPRFYELADANQRRVAMMQGHAATP